MFTSEAKTVLYLQWRSGIDQLNWRVGQLFGGLRKRLVLNTHALRIWVVHLLVYIYIYIYIYIYTRFQKGFHTERYIDRYILYSLARAPVCILHFLLSNLWKTRFNDKFFLRRVFFPIWKGPVVLSFFVFFRKMHAPCDTNLQWRII